MNILLKTYTLLFLFIICCAPRISIAATIFFDSQNNTVGVGEEFVVNVFVNTEDESINAIEGIITCDNNLLKVKDVQYGNSSVNFWIEKPRGHTDGGITFSGITPGGFIGQKEFLFSIIFQAHNSGSSEIDADTLRMFLQEGENPKNAVKISPFHIQINSESGNLLPNIQSVNDLVAPEDFELTLAHDSNIFDGKYFLVFATQDKGVGIDHYEIREGTWGRFVVAESPYLLKYQSLTKEISVKAVDKNGNEKIAVLEPQIRTTRYEILGIVVIILGLVAFGVLWKKIWPKFTRSFHSFFL